MSTYGKQDRYRDEDNAFESKPLSFVYIASKYIPSELKCNNNFHDLGFFTYLENEDLENSDLDVFRRLLGLNLCRNGDFSELELSLNFFFKLKHNSENFS